jgi:citrate lyase subunit beta / citryl-CoA lyase
MRTARPRRSVIYVPAANRKAVEKARTLSCDAVILDLEDGVAPEVKEVARDRAIDAIRAGGFGTRELIVRINGLDTPWGAADMEAVVGCGSDAVLVPKVNDAADIRRYDAALGSAPQNVRLWAMIETTRCLFRLEEIAAAPTRSRLSVLVMGTNDLANEAQARLTAERVPLQWALGMTVAAARSHDLGVLDGVFNDIEDEAGFRRQCEQGSDFGFDGKTLIHPRQIAACNRAFSPTSEALEWAQSLIDAFNLPENREKGAIRVNGKMVERLHLVQAQRMLAVHRAIAPDGQGGG